MNSLELLIGSLSKIPGLGKKTATRMAFHFLKADELFTRELGELILNVKRKIIRCSQCGNYTETDPCSICADSSRETKLLCVVEQVQDLMTLHATGEYRGVYHVLHGVISPMDGVGPEELRLPKMVSRIKELGVEEVILATNATMSGDTTALYIYKMLSDLPVKVTRLASGLPAGGDLEYADKLTIARSLRGRTAL